MKIFISHSSRDKWIARKLSEEIIALGCQTFLDEKDIDTGESIDEEINNHLGESDDFLLLLSPDSIKSHWVLIELGGALALKKRVVIILLYLGANDIPQPISKYLARDINEIEKYYSEVKKRLKGTFKEPPRRVIRRKVRPAKSVGLKFKVGDWVQLPQIKPTRVRDEIGWDDEEMGIYLGLESEVTEVDKNDNSLRIKDDESQNWWAFEWLKKVK